MATWYDKPWGGYIILDQGPGYLVKKLVINPDQRLSLQRHKHRAEVWAVASGYGVLDIGPTKRDLFPGQNAYITEGVWHRVRADFESQLMIIETWLGDELSEDDIERKEDDYGRV
jgi:mannose-6-phosphate isomerase-like protein (cupin superfamily)